MNIARLGVVVTMGIGYTISFYPARLALLDMTSHSPAVYILVTIGWFSAALAISLHVSDLGAVYSVVGSTVGVLLMFILPGLMHWPRQDDRFACGENAMLVTVQRMEAIFLILVGCVTGVVGTLLPIIPQLFE